MSFMPETGLSAGAALLATVLSFSTGLRAEVVNIEGARGCEQLVDSERSTFVMVEIDTGRSLSATNNAPLSVSSRHRPSRSRIR